MATWPSIFWEKADILGNDYVFGRSANFNTGLTNIGIEK